MLGTSLAHYRIEALLGSGGMGIVYRAFDTRLQRTVAIKLLQATPDDLGAPTRLLNEARSASGLNHANICTIHEVGEIEGQAYIVMEHVDGQPLSKRIPPGEGLPLEEILRYGIQIADGLAHAHEHAVVHRDLKSANVVITPKGRVKILDFGVARRGGEATYVRETETMVSAEQTAMVGTLLYMAPELLQGKSADTRSDIWALGVVLYEMAAGELPFAGESRYALTSAILRDPPTPMPQQLPPAFRAVILRCLAKDPEQRYQRAGEIKAALEAISPETAARRAAPARRGTVAAGIIALLVAGLIGWSRYQRAPAPAVDFIAIVPLLGTPGDREAEDVSDAISEGVIESLSEAGRSSLKVIALASVIHYKNDAIDPRRVGHELGVSRIALLRVAHRLDALAISAELIDVRDGTHIWGQRYDTHATDLLSLQTDVASKIAENLKLRLGSEQQQRLRKRPTDNIDAYQLYSRGRQFWYRSTFGYEEYQKSLEFFEQAIAKDSSYALAYSGMAETYASMAWDGWIPPKEGMEKAKAFLEKALANDPDLSEAHYVLAHIKSGTWDFLGSEEENLRGVSLNPNSFSGHRFYAHHLQRERRWDEAIAEMKKALELDPLGPETNKALGATLFWAGRYDEAVAQGRRAVDLDPSFGPAHQLLADVYERKQMYDAAIAEEQRVLRLAGQEADAETLARNYAASGYPSAMHALHADLLAALTQANTLGYVSPVAFVIVYAKLGETDQAFRWLDKAYEERAPWLGVANTDPDVDVLRNDPRFIDVMRRVGVPGVR